MPLPAEPVLAEQYGVSVGTLRRVLSDLAADGFLDRQQGRGTTVRRASFGDSLFRFFRVGDADTVEIPESRILTRDETTADAEVAAGLGLHVGGRVLHLTRLRLAHSEPLLVEDIWLPLPAATAIATVPVDELGPLLYPEYERRWGVLIGSASEQLSITTARPAQAEHLRCNDGDPLVQIDRVARTHAGDAVEFRRSFGRADTFRYQIEIR